MGPSSHRVTASQGDANRSYSDEDQSSSDLEDFNKLPESPDVGGESQVQIGSRQTPVAVSLESP